MKRVNIKYLAISAILILVLSLSSGCLPSNTETSPPPNSSPTNNTADQIDPDWVSPPVESNASVLPGIADVVAKVKPSVVAINSEVTARDFLDRPFTQEIPVGSGWIIDEGGYVVTNNHVAQGAAPNIIVILDDGRAFAAEIVGADELTDLAILKIDADNLTAISVGDSSKLMVGDWVVAIGNSLGQGISATNGIVSALDVSLAMGAGQTLYNLIQTDAAINPGNSGGPLVNIAGKVIGITSAKVTDVGVEGMGYAISIHSALPIIEDLVTVGYAIHPWLGVGLRTVNEGVAAYYGLAVNQGSLITEMVTSSPADKAGLQAGDVITGFGEKEITNTDDLIQAIRASQIGQQVEITYWRGETKHTTYATLIERPSPS